MEYEPIAYVADADEWCEDCIIAAYGATDGRDNEGNDIGACPPNCEADGPHFCGRCHRFLGGGLTDYGQQYTLETFSDNAEVRAYYDWLPWPE
jgi:hypothetical protein